MPRTLVVLQARMGSGRLPGKSMASIAGEPLVRVCLRRLVASGAGPVLLATTDGREDDVLEAEARRLGLPVVRGPRDDVLGRFVMAIADRDADVVVRATADNPAFDMDAAARAVETLTRYELDHCCERGLPYGAALEAVRASALRDAASRAMDDADREHVTLFVKRHLMQYRAAEPDAPATMRRADLRLTVDTAADLAFVRALAAALDAPLARARFSDIMAAADVVRARTPRPHPPSAPGSEPRP